MQDDEFTPFAFRRFSGNVEERSAELLEELHGMLLYVGWPKDIADKIYELSVDQRNVLLTDLTGLESYTADLSPSKVVEVWCELDKQLPNLRHVANFAGTLICHHFNAIDEATELTMEEEDKDEKTED